MISAALLWSAEGGAQAAPASFEDQRAESHAQSATAASAPTTQPTPPPLSGLHGAWCALATPAGEVAVYLVAAPLLGKPPENAALLEALQGNPLRHRLLQLLPGPPTAPQGPVPVASQPAAAPRAEEPPRRRLYVEAHPFMTQKEELAISFLAYADDPRRTRLLCTFATPVLGPARAWEEIVARAGRELEQHVRKIAPQLAPSPRVAVDAPRFAQPRTLKLAADLSTLKYRFAPPIEDYGGRVTRLRGELTAAESAAQSDFWSGKIVAEVKSLTTGADDLDDSLHSDMFLDAEKFPEAVFEFAGVDAAAAMLLSPADVNAVPLRVNDKTPATPETKPGVDHAPDTSGPSSETKDSTAPALGLILPGRFRLKDRAIPLNAYVVLIPENAAPRGGGRWRMRGQFAFNIRAFDLWPPDGPEPAQHMMLFEIDFVFE